MIFVGGNLFSGNLNYALPSLERYWLEAKGFWRQNCRVCNNRTQEMHNLCFATLKCLHTSMIHARFHILRKQFLLFVPWCSFLVGALLIFFYNWAQKHQLQDTCLSVTHEESLMSSNSWPQSISLGGIFSRDSSSPALAHAGHAFLKQLGEDVR